MHDIAVVTNVSDNFIERIFSLKIVTYQGNVLKIERRFDATRQQKNVSEQ